MDDFVASARVLKALAHPVRLQLLDCLRQESRVVCTLVGETRRRQPYVSQQLAVLRAAGVVRAEKHGLTVHYRLCDERLGTVLDTIRALAMTQGNAPPVAPRVNEYRYGGNQMSSNNGNLQWQGVPRAEIEWYPTVVADRCIGCGLCVTSCGRGVYSFDYDKKLPVVTAPQMCMVGCTTCATNCLQDAIEFPSAGYIRHLIKQRKVLRKVKEELTANRAKYDVAEKAKTE
jgi:NAD-dependent dihydropyrimidine dehydrogenase PreA subunit/DNA-binding transcriptional ArsR family regulator